MQLRMEGNFMAALPEWFDGDDAQMIISRRGVIIAHPEHEPRLWNQKRERWDKVKWNPAGVGINGGRVDADKDSA